VNEYEQIIEREKNPVIKGMRAEPQSTLLGNGSDKTACGFAPEAPELAAKHPEGVSNG
jgi:hypothetical protein